MTHWILELINFYIALNAMAMLLFLIFFVYGFARKKRLTKWFNNYYADEADNLVDIFKFLFIFGIAFLIFLPAIIYLVATAIVEDVINEKEENWCYDDS